MNKRFHVFTLLLGNLLTVGAIFFYAPVQIAFSTYALVIILLSILFITIFYLWSDTSQTMKKPFSE